MKKLSPFLWVVAVFLSYQSASGTEIRFVNPYDVFLKGWEYTIPFFTKDSRGYPLGLSDLRVKSTGLENRKIFRTTNQLYLLRFRAGPSQDGKVKVEIKGLRPDGRIARGILQVPVVDKIPSLHVKVTPEKGVVVAGTRKSITLTVEIKNLQGRRVDANIKGFVTRGRLGKFKRKKTGVYQTELFLPPEKYPQIIIVSVLGNNGVFQGVGYAKVILRGSTVLRGTTKPQSHITIVIKKGYVVEGDSDEKGYFEIPITVDPGVDALIAQVKDPYGNVTKKRISLGVPPSPLMGEPFVFPARVVGDGFSASSIFVFAVDATGRPLRKNEIVFLAHQGTIKEVSMIEPGVWVATYQPPHPSGKRKQGIEIRYKGARKAVDVEIIPFTVPLRLRTVLDKKVLPADGTGLATLAVQVESFKGRKVSPECVRVTADAKEVEIKISKRQATAYIRSPKKLLHERMNIEVHCSTKYGYTLRTRKSIRLVPGEPSEIELRAQRRTLRAGIDKSTGVSVFVTDRGGNPVPGLKLRINAASGRIEDIAEQGKGHYTFRYVPPLAKDVEIIRINVQAGRARNSLKVVVLPKLYNVGIALEAGYISNFQSISSFYPVVSFVARLPLYNRRFFTGMEISYFSFSSNQPSRNGSAYDTVVKGEFVPVFVKFRYQIPLSEDAGINFGAGIGAEFASIRVALKEEAGGAIVKERTLNFSTLLHVGGEYQLGPGRIKGGLNYAYSPLHGREGSLKTSGYTGGLFFTVGYMFTF